MGCLQGADREEPLFRPEYCGLIAVFSPKTDLDFRSLFNYSSRGFSPRTKRRLGRCIDASSRRHKNGSR